MDYEYFDKKFISEDGQYIDYIKLCKKTYKVYLLDRYYFYENLNYYNLIKKGKILSWIIKNEYQMFDTIDELLIHFRKNNIERFLKLLMVSDGENMIEKMKNYLKLRESSRRLENALIIRNNQNFFN